MAAFIILLIFGMGFIINAIFMFPSLVTHQTIQYLSYIIGSVFVSGAFICFQIDRQTRYLVTLLSVDKSKKPNNSNNSKQSSQLESVAPVKAEIINHGDTWTCKSCGEVNNSISSYCGSCGKYK